MTNKTGIIFFGIGSQRYGRKYVTCANGLVIHNKIYNISWLKSKTRVGTRCLLEEDQNVIKRRCQQLGEKKWKRLGGLVELWKFFKNNILFPEHPANRILFLKKCRSPVFYISTTSRLNKSKNKSRLSCENSEKLKPEKLFYSTILNKLKTIA